MCQVKNELMCFIRFAVFRVHEYCLHTYFLTIIVQSRVLFFAQLKIQEKFSLVLQIIINIFQQIKIKTKGFGISYHNYIFFMIIILLCWYKKCSICLVWFFNLRESFQSFICASNIGSLVSSLFGVKFSIMFLLIFCGGFDFTLSEIVSRNNSALHFPVYFFKQNLFYVCM